MEKIEGTFDFWDPGLFVDDDGRFYFYWGSGNTEPIWGVELDPVTMKPLSERLPMFDSDARLRGYERGGEDHTLPPLEEDEIADAYREYLDAKGAREEDVPDQIALMLKGIVSRKPFIEGPWMNKYKGRYYLQYACPGTEFNIYADGVYVSDRPLGPFVLAKNNPYSYKVGGFLQGAGHGSTMEDLSGNYWHASTTRISKNHIFERRVGIWPAGFDQDGELFCNQRYGDWPIMVTGDTQDPWQPPKWYLLSYGKKVSASSFHADKKPELVTDENIQTWWQAASGHSGEWLEMNLGEVYSVHAVQINFADDAINIPVPGKIHSTDQKRYIEERNLKTRWILEGSEDGECYFQMMDKSGVDTDLSHDLVVCEKGINIRFLKLTILEVPYDQKPCISGFRVFGVGNGDKPEIPEYEVIRTQDLDMNVKVSGRGAAGYNILWGHEPDKLYHSCMLFGEEQHIGALVKGEQYYMRVDAFNENGITEGKLRKI